MSKVLTFEDLNLANRGTIKHFRNGYGVSVIQKKDTELYSVAMIKKTYNEEILYHKNADILPEGKVNDVTSNTVTHLMIEIQKLEHPLKNLIEKKLKGSDIVLHSLYSLANCCLVHIEYWHKDFDRTNDDDDRWHLHCAGMPTDTYHDHHIKDEKALHAMLDEELNFAKNKFSK